MWNDWNCTGQAMTIRTNLWNWNSNFRIDCSCQLRFRCSRQDEFDGYPRKFDAHPPKNNRILYMDFAPGLSLSLSLSLSLYCSVFPLYIISNCHNDYFIDLILLWETQGGSSIERFPIKVVVNFEQLFAQLRITRFISGANNRIIDFDLSHLIQVRMSKTNFSLKFSSFEASHLKVAS